MTEALATEFLTRDELKQLTGSAAIEQQEKVLTEDGLPYKRRGRNILVSRHHCREWLAGRPVARSRTVDLSLVK